MNVKYWFRYEMFSVAASLAFITAACSVFLLQGQSRFILAISLGLLGLSTINCRHLLKRPPKVVPVNYSLYVEREGEIPRVIRFVFFNKGDFPTLVHAGRGSSTNGNGRQLSEGDVQIAPELAETMIIKGHDHLEMQFAVGIREGFIVQLPVQVELEYIFFCEGRACSGKGRILICERS